MQAPSIPWMMLMRISVRNLFRHRRRNTLPLVSVITAVASVTFLNALMRGIQVDMYATARESLNDDWLVTAPGYFDDPGLMHSFKPAKETLMLVEAQPGVQSTGRVRSPAVIMSERETRGIELAGVDPSTETFSFISHASIDGKFPAQVDERGIVLGRALADDLRTRIGKRVVVVVRDANGRSQEAGIPVIGLFDSECTGLEKRFAFVARESLESLPPPGYVTEISISIKDEEHVLDSASLTTLFPELVARSWRQL